MADDRVELGVELLDHCEDPELDMAEAVDRLETITTDPTLTRTILDTADRRGIIDREDGVIRIQTSTFVSSAGQIVRREGEYTCQRCGASLSTGHFVRFDVGDLGPFGPECVRKVTGRD